MGKGIIFFSSTGIGNAVRGVFQFSVKNSTQGSPQKAVQNGVSKAIQSCKALPVVKGRKRKNNTHEIKLLID